MEKFISALGALKVNNHYYDKNLPAKMSNADKNLNIIFDSYKLYGAEGRKKTDQFITPEIAWQLLGFSIRMATYSLRLSDERLFANGMVALSIIIDILDKREVLIAITLFFDIKQKHCFSFNSFLKQNDRFSVLLEDFTKRKPEDQSLECMGYTLTADENSNLIYKRI